MIKPKHILAFITVVALAVLVAWGASQYYGERRTGQKRLLPGETEIVTLSEFRWRMNDPNEVVIDAAHAPDAEFVEGQLIFTTTADTYITLNLSGNKLNCDRQFLLQLKSSTEKNSGQISITLSQGLDSGVRRFVSHRVALPEEDSEILIDLYGLPFEQADKPGESLRWGEDFHWADGFRIDFDELGSSQVVIDEISFLPGMVLDVKIEDLWRRGEKQDVIFVRQGSGLRLPNETELGTFITPPIGLGTVGDLYDVAFSGSQGQFEVRIRGGVPNDEEIDWGDWADISEDGKLPTLNKSRYLQFRFELNRRPGGRTGSLTGFRLRYIDPTPPGMDSPLFGSYHLPTFHQGIHINSIRREGATTGWIRLPLSQRHFERIMNRLVAEDIAIICSVDLEEFERDEIVDAVRRYGGRISIWEFSSKHPRAAQFYTDLFGTIHKLQPSLMLLPERIGPDYFQKLAESGEYGFATTSGTQEEVLDRGFAWFFVMALIGLAIVVALSPAIGYNFRLGRKELAATGIGLVVSAAVLIPVMLLTGLAGLTLPRDFAQIEIAFNRYVVSALLQEFVRALLILLPVAYLVKHGIKEKSAWFWIIAASSLLFGLGHLGYPGLSPQEVLGFVIVTTLAGAIMGAVFYKTRSLTSVMILHLLSNIFLSTMTDIGPRL